MTVVDPSKLERMIKNSQRAGWSVLVGALIVAAAMVFSFVRLYLAEGELETLNGEIGKKQTELSDLETKFFVKSAEFAEKAKAQADELKQLEREKELYSNAAADMMKSQTALAEKLPPAVVQENLDLNGRIRLYVVPYASARELPTDDPKKARRRYEFTTKLIFQTGDLTLAKKLSSTIADVQYRLNHRTDKLMPVPISKNKDSGFAVSFKGYEDWDQVIVVIRTTSNDYISLDLRLSKFLPHNLTR